MNIKLIKFLAGLCAILLLVILGEWLYLNHARKALLEEIKTVDKKPKPMAELPTLELTRRPESSYVNMVSRPLFIQGRRPVNEAPQATAAKPVASGTFNWTLNGIYTHKRRTYALLTRNGAKVPKDNFRKVSVSSDIDGWQVEEIQKDKIVVSQADQRKELPLHKIKPKTNNPAQPQNPGMATMPPPVIPGQVPPPGIPAEQMPDGMVPPVPANPGTRSRRNCSRTDPAGGTDPRNT